MSIRFGVALALEPVFTARAYRARQLICGQYASWAAEMHMVHLALADYFVCPDSAVAQLESGLSAVAAESRRRAPQFPLANRGVVSLPDMPGHAFLDFAGGDSSEGLASLYSSVVAVLEQTPGVCTNLKNARVNYQPRLPLLQHAKLPAPVIEDVMEFARSVVTDLQIPATTQAWRLLLLRFQSDAAGENWDAGLWAADLRWELLGSHPL